MGRRCSRAEKEKRKIWARGNVWAEWCEICTKDICLVYQIVEVCEEKCFIFQGIFYSIQLGRYINKVFDVRDTEKVNFSFESSLNIKTVMLKMLKTTFTVICNRTFQDAQIFWKALLWKHKGTMRAISYIRFEPNLHVCMCMHHKSSRFRKTMIPADFEYRETWLYDSWDRLSCIIVSSKSAQSVVTILRQSEGNHFQQDCSID